MMVFSATLRGISLPLFRIISVRGLPGGTIGMTLASLSMINSMTVGAFVFFRALSKAAFISSAFVTRIPFAP